MAERASTPAPLSARRRAGGVVAAGLLEERCLNGVDDNKAGYSMASLGDMDADGMDDLLVGARFGGEAGVAYVVGGPITGGSLSESTATLHGAGALDVLVGASNADLASERDGGAYLLLGPASGASSLGDAHARLLGGDLFSTAGNSVAALGDINGDGLPDLAVGAHSWGEGEPGADESGMDIAPGGDLTGDGLDDMVVGAAGDATMGVDGGAAYVISLGG